MGSLHQLVPVLSRVHPPFARHDEYGFLFVFRQFILVGYLFWIVGCSF